MIFVGRENINIIEFSESGVALSTVLGCLKRKRTNVFYVEREKTIYGVISAGDILRILEKGDNRIEINTCFVFLHEKNPMKAIDVFSEHPRICNIPIVDKFNKLVGEYQRWDDLLIDVNARYFNNNFFVKSFLEDNDIFLASDLISRMKKCEQTFWLKKALKNMVGE